MLVIMAKGVPTLQSVAAAMLEDACIKVTFTTPTAGCTATAANTAQVRRWRQVDKGMQQHATWPSAPCRLDMAVAQFLGWQVITCCRTKCCLVISTSICQRRFDGTASFPQAACKGCLRCSTAAGRGHGAPAPLRHPCLAVLLLAPAAGTHVHDADVLLLTAWC